MRDLCKCGFAGSVCHTIDASHCPFAEKGSKGPKPRPNHVPHGYGAKRRKRKKPKTGVPKALRNENMLKQQVCEVNRDTGDTSNF